VVDPALPDRHAVISIREVPAEVIEIPAGASPDAAERLVEERALSLLRSRAADFLGIAETKQLLDRLEGESPATVRNVVPKFVDLATLADVLRRLVEEDVSVRDLRSILEALARSHPGDRSAETLTERVRGEFQRALTYELTGGAPDIPVVLLDSTIEHTIRSGISKTSAGGFLTLGPAAARDVVSAIERAMHDARQGAREAPVLLVASDIRRFVRGLVEADLPDVRVIAFNELSPEVVLKTLAHATVRGAGQD
jgi:type III secretion protein V